MNWTGNVPILLWSRPTPIGERVWLLLRSGVDVVDIEWNLRHIASGCPRCSASDCRLWLMDGKRVELGLWRSCAEVFVGSSLDHAVQVLGSCRARWTTATTCSTPTTGARSCPATTGTRSCW
jgi:hypothetical protein